MKAPDTKCGAAPMTSTGSPCASAAATASADHAVTNVSPALPAASIESVGGFAAPTAGIDLPLKVLVWSDAAGQTWLSYNDPKYLQQRHHLSPELARDLAGVDALVEQAAR